MILRWPLLFVLVSVVAAWSITDREIFTLKDQVESDLGKGATFYDFLEVSRKATDAELTKAYRRLSRRLHPDKNPSKSATERFSRLGIVATLLRSDARERYDFFLNHGFPRWKGSDYYYSRYRPGLGTVAVFLYFFISFGQFVFMKLTAARHRSHMESVIADVKAAAVGNPVTKRQVVLPSGKTFVVYPEGTVFLVHNEAEYFLNVDEIKNPRWRDTILVTLPRWLVFKTTGRQIFYEPDGQVLGDADSDADAPKKKVKKRPAAAPKVGAVRRPTRQT